MNRSPALEWRIWIAGGALLCISAGGGTARAADRTPAFCIPRMSAPPRLDGVLDPAEWREAVAISGVEEQGSKELCMRPTTFFLAWDPDHLYLACRTWVMPGFQVGAAGRAPGDAGCGDVGLELHFQPVGKVAAGQTDSSYKFNVNALGMYGECCRVSVGQLFKTWVPGFRIAVRQTGPGTAPTRRR